MSQSTALMTESELGYALSPQQRHLWRLGGGSGQAGCIMRLQGDLDAQLLAAALHQAVDRFEILRSSFPCPAGHQFPVQVIRGRGAPELTRLDLTCLQPGDAFNEIEGIFRQQASAAFDLGADPRMRATLLPQSRNQHCLLVTLPSMAADRATLHLLAQALARALQGSNGGAEDDEAIQYADFAQWQNEMLSAEEDEAAQDFWRDFHGMGFTAPSLPFGRKALIGAPFQARTRSVQFPLADFERLRLLAQRQEAQPEEVLLAAWAALLWRMSGESPPLLGMLCDGRKYDELKATWGPCARAVPIGCPLAADVRFSELLEEIAASSRDGYEFQEAFSWEESLESGRIDPARAFFPFLFEYDDQPDEYQADGIKVAIPLLECIDDRFFLKLLAARSSAGLRLSLLYDAACFNHRDAVELEGCLRALLGSLSANPEVRLAQAGLLSEEARERLLRGWNATRQPYPRDLTLNQLFEGQCGRTPQSAALIFGDHQVSYGELDRQSNRLAHALRGLGVGPESKAAICIERSVGMAVAVLAALKAGGAYVPLDPEFPGARLQSTLEQSAAAVLLTQQSQLARFAARRMPALCPERDRELLEGQPESAPLALAGPDNLAYVVFTSGTSGKPKGVSAPHRGAVSYLEFLRRTYLLGSRDRVLQVSSLAFDASLRDLIGPLLSGACVVLVENDRAKDPSALISAVGLHDITALPSVVPSLLRVMLQAGLRKGGHFNSVRLVLASGERLYLGDCSRARRVFGGGAWVVNQYGPTECTMTSSYYRVPADQPHGFEDSGRSALIGRPIANASFYVVDQMAALVPVGIAGELYIGGVGLTRGYLRRPGLTAEAFVPDPFGPAPGARLYRTGDLVRYLPEGQLEFMGRRDRQLKMHGFRIEPAEIEAALLRHPAVQQAAVVCQGQAAEGQRLLAYLVLKGGHQPDLRTHLMQRLPDYMVPSVFTALDAFPLTPNGKIDYRALPAPQGPGRAEKILPRNPLEELLAAIWAELLGVEQAGVNEDFFEDLGGHSLLATRLTARLSEIFQREIPLRWIFDASTLERFAEKIEAAQKSANAPAVPPIRPASDPGPAPLSFAQERVWFLDQLDPGKPTYNIPSALRIRGPLEVECLAGAIAAAVARHEILRTTFAVADESPLQVVSPPPKRSLGAVDLAGLAAEKREAEAARLVQREARRPFELSRGPLFRALALRLAPAEHLLFFNMHHIISDAWSIGILIREVAACYQAFLDGDHKPLPPLAIQYSDFARWQRRELSQQVLADQLAYWEGQLSDLPPSLELPFDHPRPAVRTYRGAQQSLTLPESLSAPLRRLGASAGATLFMTLLAGLQTLLFRYTGQGDLSVGTAVSGRGRLQTEGLIGFFADTVVLRVALEAGLSFRELLGRVRETALRAYSNQDLPFERLVEELQPERSLVETPLFQVMLVFQHLPLQGAQLPGLQLSSYEFQRGTAKFDLELMAMEAGGRILATLEYDSDLFDDTTIVRALGHLRRLLEGAAANPGQALSDLPLLGGGECHQLLAEWNQSASETDQEGLFLPLFRLQAEEGPDAAAAGADHLRLSYGELNGRADRLACHLIGEGAGPERVIALLAERGIEFLVAMLGIWKAGAAYLPLDPRHPVNRHTQVLERSQAGWVLSTHQFDPVLSEALSGMQQALRPKLLRLGDPAAGAGAPQPRPAGCLADQLAYVIYTSGSTGLPKGAMVTHGGMLNHLRAKVNDLDLTSRDLVAQNASQCFDISVWQFLAALAVGGQVQILADEVAHDPARLLEGLAAHGVSILEVVPSFLRFLLEELSVRAASVPPLRGLRWLIPTGEALPPELCRSWLERFAKVPLLNAYGPTECSDDVSHARIDRPPAKEAVRVPIGRCVRKTGLFLLDPRMRPVPIGVAGELYVAGAGVGRGYLNEARRTAESFVPDAFSEGIGARLYRSGDLVRRLTEGSLDFLGRIDHQVKIRGFRIELGEIEAALREHPAVSEAVVTARPDGSGELRLAGYVVPVGDPPPLDELSACLKDSLPDYMLPQTLTMLEALPLTPNGKVDRRALPAPERQLDAADGPERPRGHIQEMVAEIWRQVLEREEVGLEDDFFDLGGHSLLATQVISRVRQALRVEIPLQRLFAKPTVAQLSEAVAEAMRAASGAAPPPFRRVERNGPLPLSFAQQRLWFVDQMDPGNPVYNIPAAVAIEGALSIAALKQALSEILRRHESLRTTFRSAHGKPFQVIAPPRRQQIGHIDLSALSQERRDAEQHRLAREEAQMPFDLSAGPLLRVALLQLAEHDQVVVLTMHHIVSDEWSARNLMNEISALYQACLAGKPSPLKEPPLQYADFAAWQRRWFDSPAMEAQLAYWKEQLAGAPTLTGFPTDRPRPAVQSFKGERRPFDLSPPLRQGLKDLSRRQGATLFMVCLAAFQALLHWYTGKEDVVVGSDIANRNWIETEGMIGFFVNQLTLRTNLAGNPSFEELLERVREVTLQAYAHQDLPFDVLVERLKPERSLQHSPLFQIKLNLLNVPVQPTAPGEVTLRSMAVQTGSAKFDLMLDLFDDSQAVAGMCEYNTDLFDWSTIRLLLARLEALLAAVAKRPGARLDELGGILEDLGRQEELRNQRRFRELRRQRLSSRKAGSDSPAASKASPLGSGPGK